MLNNLKLRVSGFTEDRYVVCKTSWGDEIILPKENFPDAVKINDIAVINVSSIEIRQEKEGKQLVHKTIQDEREERDLSVKD